ncbi:hypothetical protein JOF53_003619 [Crossiella equi]|uniref:PD-(D/E)XK motif protein n=1 Tax=Crossiella equi TaxID=130796 RepID=A0ABS5AEL5_9PSEU|nr:PD-(D/E)XK motif protein [Crossiella equi]MBP2474747.1 hypothetical protein [Crossiella equi]
MSADVSRQDRHLSPEHLGRVLDERIPFLNPIPGAPAAWLFVTPAAGHMGLRIHAPDVGRTPPTHLQHVSTRLTHQASGRAFEVVVTVPALFRAAYPLLCSVADRVQLDKMRPADALAATLRQFETLLKPDEEFPREREIGLFGELLSLAGLIDAIDAETAVAGWRGGDREEHDLGLADSDIEVKTTTSERRVHWVESLTQLSPTHDRPLWLVSHQLTQAGAGAGARLPDLITSVRGLVGSGADRDSLEAGLAAWGWSDGLAEQCRTRWTRRTPSAAYTVAGDFPRLTQDDLTGAGVALERLTEVRYRVDLTGLDPVSAPPAPLVAAISFEEG